MPTSGRQPTRTEVIRESRDVRLRLTDDQAEGLRQLGQRLASSRSWWGSTDDAEDKTIVLCDRQVGDDWRVRVVDAVGVLGVGDLEIIVEPKIPTSHFLFLAAHSGHLPRIDDQPVSLERGQSLYDLLCTWFVGAAERLLRADLIKDYRSEHDRLRMVRGSVDAPATARSFYVGRMEFDCEFEEFDVDNPLNRLVLAAAGIVAARPTLNLSTRRRARRVMLRLQGVSKLKASDHHVRADRRSGYYADAVALAKALLTGAARQLTQGGQRSWTFLLRTPPLVEDGLRAVLTTELANQAKITKKGIGIPGTSLTLNPDLVVSGRAIADVKYKLAESTWRRPDLYQVVTFCEGFGVTDGAMIDFGYGTPALESLAIGRVTVSHLRWDTSPGMAPEEATLRLATHFRRWLDIPASIAG